MLRYNLEAVRYNKKYAFQLLRIHLSIFTIYIDWLFYDWQERAS